MNNFFRICDNCGKGSYLGTLRLHLNQYDSWQVKERNEIKSVAYIAEFQCRNNGCWKTWLGEEHVFIPVIFCNLVEDDEGKEGSTSELRVVSVESGKDIVNRKSSQIPNIVA